MQVVCSECKNNRQFDPNQYRCACGGVWEPLETDLFDTEKIHTEFFSVWRYKAMLGLDVIQKEVSLGAGWTPLVASEWGGRQMLFKLEYISPTGSFKDRGTEVEMNYLKSVGVTRIVEDSSGNAGASAAAYAARIGLQAEIYAPESASPSKLSQIEVYGAHLHKIAGARINATNTAMEAVANGIVYASHAYNPVYLLGQETAAWEVWEQMDREVPDAVVVPVGQCGLLLGMWFGFRRLEKAGLIKRIPRLFAAQPDRLAPIHHAFINHLDDIPEMVLSEASIAEGLAIVKPVRSKRIMQALYESDGAAVVVSENQIREAYLELAHRGFFVEPTSAVAAAAVEGVYDILSNDARILVMLTGSGLKSTVLQ